MSASARRKNLRGLANLWNAEPDMGRSYTGNRARTTVIRLKSQDRGDPPRVRQKKSGATQG
jgi:hypothetical protein